MTGQDSRFVYALDIGTRKVAGIILDKTHTPWQAAAVCIIEQEPGAMEDGQIHDVRKVSAVIRQVTEDLERQTQLKLTQVAVAAAGRSLRTQRGQSRTALSPLETVTDDLVHGLELEAVRQAREELGRTYRIGTIATGNPYIFVAYSVTRYNLDGARIGSLVGQRGTSAEAEVIATFLPRVVIDSLSSALQGANLEMSSLTLEPIAALNVAIPPSMRSLNLALVDIGAGTSDIAITKDQTVTAYGMVPTAGDEITRSLTEHYLLDFTEGERVKRLVSQQEEIEIVDALGFTSQVASREVQSTLWPAAENLAKEIAEETKRLNGGDSPQAVICVGGGAATPGLRELLSVQLGLPVTRVAVRGRDIVRGIEGAEEQLSGPASITPLGIAALAGTSSRSPFINIQLNEGSYRLLKTAVHTVKEALIAAGIGLSRLLGPPGEPLSVRVNGQLKVIPGPPGTSAQVSKNGVPCTLDEDVVDGDVLSVSEPKAGEPPELSVNDVVKLQTRQIEVEVNGRIVELEPQVLVNGRQASLNSVVKDGDEVAVTGFDTVKDLVTLLIEKGALSDTKIRYTVNGAAHSLPLSELRVLVNGRSGEENRPLSLGDKVAIYEKSQAAPTIGDVLARIPQASGRNCITVCVNGEPITLQSSQAPSITVNGSPAEPSRPVRNGDRIAVKSLGNAGFMVNDVFRYYDPHKYQERGRTLEITVNGQPAGFTTPLGEKDEIELMWR